MKNKNKIIVSSLILISTLTFSTKTLFAQDLKDEKEKTVLEVVEIKEGLIDDISLKFEGNTIYDSIKFRVTNKNTNESQEYLSSYGKLEAIKVKSEEIYTLELIDSKNYQMKPIEFKVKYDSRLIATTMDGKKLSEIKISKKVIDNNISTDKGWKLENGFWKYYDNGNLKKGWIFDENEKSWYYSDENGNRITGWHFDKTYNNYYYFNKDGKMLVGWLTEDGKKYYFNKSGAYQKNIWVFDNEKWYYLNSNGNLETGWFKSGNKWYYLNEKGVMQTGWINLKGKWYYLNKSGSMHIGWLQEGGSWYYLNSNGSMAVDWVYAGKKWYYMNTDGTWNPSGIAFANWYVLNGKFRTNDGSKTANVGKDYIVVSLSYQKLWLVRNNSVIMNTGVVSGKPSTPTVVGNFKVQSKETGRYLKGDDYKVWVDYWMPFHYDYGIHDASWHRGYTRYQNPNSYKYHGSHGCVNIYTGDMPTIYSNSYVGMPVIVIP